MRCDGCNSEINVVPVRVVWVSPNFDKHPLQFDYCPECIKSDLQKGFVVTDLKGDVNLDNLNRFRAKYDDNDVNKTMR